MMGLHCGSASSLASKFADEQPKRNKEPSKKGKAGFKGFSIRPFYECQEFPLVMNATDWCQIKAANHREFALSSKTRTSYPRLRVLY
jgi:hypothetical protein